jgi:type IV pilus assembly protein PilC
MIRVSIFLQNSWFAIILFVIGLVILYKFLYSKVLPFKIFIDKLTVKTPIVSGVVKTLYMYKFSRLLSQFYYAGISPILALKLLSNIFENFEYKKKMIEIRKDLKA